MHVLQSRPATDKELAAIHRHAHVNVGSYLSVTFLFGILPTVILTFVGGRIGGMLSTDHILTGRCIGGLLGATIFLWAILDLRRSERRHHEEAILDEVDHTVEEITVTNPRVLQLASQGDNDPVLALDIGGNEVLLLQGAWLHDPRTYGTHDHGDSDANDGIMNGLPHPFSFPSTSFTITRLPHSGDVLRIEVHGNYIRPDQTVGALPHTYNFRDSEIFDGSLDDLPHVLDEAHRHSCPDYRATALHAPAPVKA
jgi:hypothetical protein